jgi:hypothetical protein
MSDDRRYWIGLTVSLPGPETPFTDSEDVGPTLTELELDGLVGTVAEDLIKSVIVARRQADLPASWFLRRATERNHLEMTMTFRDDRGTLASVADSVSFGANYESDLKDEGHRRATRLATKLIKAARRPFRR